MILILVLLILVAVVALALSLAREVKVEVSLAVARRDALHLQAMVDSAVARAQAELRRDAVLGDTLADSWRDAEAELAGMEMPEGRTWLFFSEPDPGDGRELRYGLRDESSKLDVNLASREALLALPIVTEEAVDGILDWRDEDDEPLEFGAESDYYASLDPPYLAKNAPLETLGELLRIRGIDAAMVYGEDRNRNGVLDPGEDDGDGSFPPDDADGLLDRGLIDYLCVYSRELNRTLDNRARLNVNGVSPIELGQRLDLAGVNEGTRNQVVQRLSRVNSDISSLGELVFRMGVTEPEQLSILLDELSVSDEDLLGGRINLNTAPRELIAGLPGLNEDDVEAILSARSDGSRDLSSPAWLIELVELPTFAGLIDLVTTRAEQFSVQAVALLHDRPRFKRVEVVLDRSHAPVRVLSYRDLSGLGFPFPGERGEDLP